MGDTRVESHMHERADMHVPQNPQSLLLIGIFGLLGFYTLYVTREIVVPIVFAVVLHLLLQPPRSSLWQL